MYKNFTNQPDYNQSLEKQKSPGKPGFALLGETPLILNESGNHKNPAIQPPTLIV